MKEVKKKGHSKMPNVKKDVKNVASPKFVEPKSPQKSKRIKK